MQSKIIEKDIAEVKKYPCIKSYQNNKDLVVLFYGERSGVVIYSDCGREGEHATYWKEDDFIPFNGSVELSN